MRTLMIFAIGLVFGASGGVVVTASNSVVLNEHDNSAAGRHVDMDHSAMSHEKMDHAAIGQEGNGSCYVS